MRILSCLRGLLVLGAINTSTALAVIDNNAPVVKLRDLANGGCIEAGVGLNNCFTSITTLNSWVSSTRKPSATTPLLVEIGPGKFLGAFTCDKASYAGYVTLQGAGMLNTVIEASSSPVNTTECVQMRFSDMTLRNTGNLFGVRNFGGSTFWDNVHIDGFGYAWFDSPGGCGTSRGTHYWFNSKLTSRTAANSSTAYFNACDESWFFGSEITANATVSGGQNRTIAVVGGEVHVYGSVIRSLSGSGITTSSAVAALVDGTGKIHIHGTGIDVISTSANNIFALSASNGGEIHANVSSYNLSTGNGGTMTRISNAGGHVHAPYNWEAHTTPPSIISQDGADTAVITSATGSTPRFVIYSTACSSKWFDVGSNACRP